jgi:DNA-binding NtrC family response regulator
MATVRPHVVFLDLVMPKISGLEVLKYVREHHPTVQVIVITGNAAQLMRSQARDGGAFAIVGKPADFNPLEALVAEAMRLAPRP